MTKTMLTLILPFSLIYAALDFSNIYNDLPECLLDCSDTDNLASPQHESFCDWVFEKQIL